MYEPSSWRGSVLFFLLVLLLCSFEGYEGKQPFTKPKPEPKPKPKPLNLNIEGLPSLIDVLKELNISTFFNKFVEMGVVETRLLLQLGHTDFSIMSWDWEMPQEDINRLREHVKLMITKATIPEQDDSKAKEYNERGKLTYGRMYMANAVQSFEYTLASFGAPPSPMQTMEMVLGMSHIPFQFLFDFVSPSRIQYHLTGALSTI